MKSTEMISSTIKNKNFRFAIIADPQIMPRNAPGHKPHPSQSGLEQACRELTELERPIDFLVYLGDIVNSPDESSYENFKVCTNAIRCPSVIVHGNHDSRSPYTPHKKIMMEYMKSDEMCYSFDAGEWHFSIIPCYEGDYNEYCEELLAFLRNDLEQNKEKNTILLIHMHMIPQGNSQSEWYCYVLEMRRKLMALIDEYPNVKYYMNGHVHTNLKASYKNYRRYKGVTYLSVPSVTCPRPWGEEIEGCVTEDGGNYLVIDVNGEDLEIRGRQAFKDRETVYPKGENIPLYKDDIEPRWWNRLQEIAPNERFANGNFEDGLNGWLRKFRYTQDALPTAVEEVTEFGGRNAARCYNRAAWPNDWGNDENCEIYQIFKIGKEPVVGAEYFLKNAPFNGGGFIRFVVMQDEELKFMMMFRWGKNENRTSIIPQCFGYELTGRRQGWSFFNELGNKSQGLYFNIGDEEGKWNSIKIDVQSLYNETVKGREVPGYKDLGVNKLMIGLGTWINKEMFDDAQLHTSEAFFGNITVSEGGEACSYNNGRIIVPDGTEFFMRFGNN